MQAELKWAFWAEKWDFKLKKKAKNSNNQCQNHFLTCGEMHGKNKILRLTLVWMFIYFKIYGRSTGQGQGIEEGER